jgi:putative ABC transport system permease protein
MQVVENGQSKVIAALASDPVVDAMATASSIPLNGLVPNVTIVTERGSAITAAFNDVSPGYFDLLSIPILRGRNFTLEETVSRAPVAIVSAATAQRLFGSEKRSERRRWAFAWRLARAPAPSPALS